jgi:hypothetical protein
MTAETAPIQRQDGENTKRLLSFMLLFALVAELPCPLVAQAGSQAGGLPAVAARVSALEAAVTALQTTVTALQTANNNLQNALNAEVAARTAGDNALQAALNQETTERKSADAALQTQTTGLQGALSTETTNRLNGDLHLEDLITAGIGGKAFSTSVSQADLPNGASTTVAALGTTANPLPPGHYLVTAKGWVFNPEHDAFWLCFLFLNDSPGFFDQIDVITESEGLNATNSQAAFMLEGVITLTAPGKVKMDCQSGEASSDVHDIKLIAVQVTE